MKIARFTAALVAVVAFPALAACGGGGGGGNQSGLPKPPTGTSGGPLGPPTGTGGQGPFGQQTGTGAQGPPGPQGSSTSPSALQAESASAATGDIPDNQVFLVYRSLGWSIKYPEGWAQTGPPWSVTFRDKNNIVRVVVQHGALPSVATVRRQVASLSGAHVTSAPKATTISGARAIKAVYRTQSAANAVTGKRVTLTVDRYYLASGGRVATVDLGTPVGVDNVDAYRLMVQSFRWR